MFSPERDVADQVEAEVVARLDHPGARLAGPAARADELYDALRAFVLRGGRRMRASFLWWGWVAGGGPHGGDASNRTPVLLGCAVELLQTCALIHDDVMDGSGLRRGGPSMHEHFAAVHRSARWAGDPRAYGVGQAVLAGDLALVLAEDVMRDVPFQRAVRRDAERLWQATRAEMIAGQHLDLRLSAEGSDSPEAALRAAELKSALYSVARPLELGAVAAGADTTAIRTLRAFGRRVGLAFQLHDDLLGVFGETAATGKPCGDDVRGGKRTYLAAVALDAACARGDAAAQAALRRALGDPALGEDGLAEFRALLWDLGAVHAVRKRIALLVQEAVDMLRTGRFAAHCVAALSDLADRATGDPPAAAKRVAGGPERR